MIRVFMLAALIALPAAARAEGNGEPYDPLEPVNRAIFQFNEAVDNAILKPVAEGYRAVTPKPVQTGVRNFFSNLDDVTVFANDVLQLKVESATRDLLRVGVNTTFGLFGLLDVAGEMGLKKRDRDFGTTLGYWGVPEGAYVVLPILGPSSVRDGAGRLVDYAYLDPVYNRDVFARRTAVVAVGLISRRAELLEAKRALDEAALEPYEFNRDLYLEHSRHRANEGRAQTPR